MARHENTPGAHDCFRPPEIPVEVRCLHCGEEYESYLVQWTDHPGYPGGGFWACPTPGCDGKGFTYDIWPTDPDWTDEEGNKIPFADDSDPDIAFAQDWYSDDPFTDEEFLNDEFDLSDEDVLDDDLLLADDEYDTLSPSRRDSEPTEYNNDDDLPF